MGTRSIVAVGNMEKWEGVYCHWDGYPTHMGHEVWAYMGHGAGVVENGAEALKFLLEHHPGGFSSFADVCYCHSYFAKRDGSAAKDSPYYKADVTAATYRSGDDIGGLEWLYIADPAENVLRVCAIWTPYDPKTYKRLAPSRPLLVETISLPTHITTLDEPDWKAIQKKAERIEKKADKAFFGSQKEAVLA